MFFSKFLVQKLTNFCCEKNPQTRKKILLLTLPHPHTGQKCLLKLFNLRFSGTENFFLQKFTVVFQKKMFFGQKLRKILTKKKLHFLRFLEKKNIKKNKINKKIEIFFFKKNSKSFEKKTSCQATRP